MITQFVPASNLSANTVLGGMGVAGGVAMGAYPAMGVVECVAGGLGGWACAGAVTNTSTSAAANRITRLVQELCAKCAEESREPRT